MKQGLLALALLVGWSGSALADVTVEQSAYAFQTAPQQKNGAVFVSLKNTDETDVSITGISTDIAERAELHTMSMQGDRMEMRQVDAFTIPAGETLALEPTGNHIMLMGLNEQLSLDQTFPITVSLDNDETIEIDVLVVKPGFSHKKQ